MSNLFEMTGLQDDFIFNSIINIDKISKEAEFKKRIDLIEEDDGLSYKQKQALIKDETIGFNFDKQFLKSTN